MVHFQQILNSYGSNAVFHWLKQPSRAIRVVTVHELDPDQLEFPERNKTYELADGIIVHCEEMKKQMVKLSVPEDKIHVVLHGATVPVSLPETPRSGIMFYAGHKVMTNKGIQTLFQAMAIIQKRMGEKTPTLKIHGHYGETVPREAEKLAAASGLSASTPKCVGTSTVTASHAKPPAATVGTAAPIARWRSSCICGMEAR